MKKRTIIIVELSMVGGAFAALYLVPNDTRLSTFLIASGLCFLAGNLLLFAKARKAAAPAQGAKTNPWVRLLRVFAICGGAWILIWLLVKI